MHYVQYGREEGRAVDGHVHQSVRDVATETSPLDAVGPEGRQAPSLAVESGSVSADEQDDEAIARASDTFDSTAHVREVPTGYSA